MEIQKNINVPFEKKLTSYTHEPKDGTKFLIKRNLENLLPSVLNDINEFTHTNDIKYKSLCQLQNIIMIAQNSIEDQLEQIIKTVARFTNYEEDVRIQKICIIISELIGVYIDCNIYVPLIITLLQGEESKNNLKYMSNILQVFSVILQNETIQTIEEQLKKIIDLLQNFEQIYEDNEEVLISLYLVDKQLINIGGDNLAIYCRQLFTILLNVQATTKFGKLNFEQIDSVMLKLSQICGYTDVVDLHQNEISILLDEFTKNQSYKEWNKLSRDRFKFDVIVRNSKEGISKFMPTILEIISHNSNRDSEIEIKIDMLVLIEFLVSQEKLHNTLKEYSLQLLNQVLIPAIHWKVGKPQTRTRKAGVINIIKIFDNDLISSEQVMTCINELLPPVKTCLEDDYTADLRYAACNLCERIFKCVYEKIDYEHIFNFYQCLLERLDDSQDAIRMEITKSLNVFFSFPCLKSSLAIYEYTVRALFIHLDDQNEDIQNCMFNCLKFAARFQFKIVLEEAQKVQAKMKYPRRCTEIINFCEEIRNDQQ